MIIKNKQQLREIYAKPGGRALTKTLTNLEKHSINFINHSPFLILSTANQSGQLDASPRGGQPGFIKVINSNKIILPDASGNNRLDSLENIIEQDSVGLLFFIPGVDETLRINGKAQIRIDQTLLDLFKAENKPPVSVLEIDIEEVFLHCAKALMRSKLWDKNAQINRADFPTMGQMLKDQLNDPNPAESLEAMRERYLEQL